MKHELEQFTYKTYVSLVQDLLSTKSLCTFCDYDETLCDNPLILRHDVDFCTSKALELAIVEADQGFRSTYFILLTSDQYNPLAIPSREEIRKISQLGHKIGLHYDVMALHERHSQIEEALEKEILILADLVGQEITVIAMHNPSVYGNDPLALNERYINVYDDKFIKDITYISDSCGAWRDKSYLALSGKKIEQGLQLNTHPIHWGVEPENRWVRLDYVYKRRQEKYNASKLEVTEMWNKHGGVYEHERRRIR